MKKRPKFDKRPWGKEDIFTINEKTSVKILTLSPRKRNSLQTHKNRSEFWYALDNSFKATVGNKTFTMKKNDSVVVKKGVKHRMTGLTKKARILEISQGNFKESDIKRLEDDYGRK
jgi:mannose-6-phosphate isomerase